MAAKILKFRKYMNGTYKAVVWMDDSKTVGASQPDPTYVREYQFAALPAGTTETAYVAALRQEVKRSVLAEIAVMTDQGTPLPPEGQTL